MWDLVVVHRQRTCQRCVMRSTAMLIQLLVVSAGYSHSTHVRDQVHTTAARDRVRVPVV